jgi:hypothetical protein
MLPSDALGDAERLLLLATLEQIDVLHADDDFTAALESDAAAAIGVAFSLMPIKEMTLRCQSAFKFDPASASNFDPFGRRVLAVALAPSELVGVAETVRARAA